ncbi:hypothetical protein Ndes2526B_g05447 [Nannochloris sp. 'desiccata']
MLGCCAVKTAALRPTCACCSLHLPARGARVGVAHHPQYAYRTNRPTKWSILPRALLPQRSEEQSEQAFDDQAAATFASLLQECYQTTAASPTPAAAIALRPGINGRGIFSTGDIPSTGKILMNVPLKTCLVVDYSQRLQLPPGGWPRVQRGLAKDDALPWDIIHALALLDGLAGDGNDFWSRYTNELLPSPESLTLPVCLPEELLVQLEHPPIIEAARQQKQRLRDLFPGLSAPLCENGPTYLEWAFACVRSRAFCLGQDIFAFIPFLDAANHNIDPNTNFEMSADGSTVNLVSLKEIKENEELTISYTGSIGYTNQRYMAQYGFVPLGGNPFDRIVFQCIDGDGSMNSSVMQSPVLLSLDSFMNLFGDGEAMVDAFSGRDAYMYAALKSLPFAAMESDAAPMAEQLQLCRNLLDEVLNEQKEWKTSIEEDAALLINLSEKSSEMSCSVDSRLEAVVRYRLYRKKMVDSTIKVLRAFIRGSH